MVEQTLNMSDENLEQHIVTLFEKLECLRNSRDQQDDLSGRVPARLEVRTLSLWKAVVAECAASFFYVLLVCGAASGAGVGASASAVLMATALASGCAIATLTLCFANISGAHVSPAVSAALCVRRRISPLRAALYMAAQCGGGIAGAAAVYGVSVPGYAGSLSAALPGAAAGGAVWERLGVELVLSALIASTYIAAHARRWTGTAPALLGAAYTAATLVSMPSLNPARSLGPAFVLSRWEGHWVCWVGGLGGGLACGLLHEWGSRRKSTDNSRSSSPRDLDDLDKPAFPTHYRHAPTYCPAVPRPDQAEPLYSGSKSLYCRSPPPSRHGLHRSAGSATHISQSVYSKGSAGGAGGAGGPLVSAQSLLLRPPLTSHPHALAHSQNAHNAQRDPGPAYGTTARPGPAGASVQESRRESVYSGSTRRGPLSSDDSVSVSLSTSAYGTYSRAAGGVTAVGGGPYRAPLAPPHPPDHY